MNGLNGKNKKNSTSTSTSTSKKTPGVHLAARVRGPGFGPAGAAHVPRPRRQGAPLSAAREECARPEAADDRGRRKGGAEEACERQRQRRWKVIRAFLLPFLSSYRLLCKVRFLWGQGREAEELRFLVCFPYSRSCFSSLLWRRQRRRQQKIICLFLSSIGR